MTRSTDALVVGADGLSRCWWSESASDELRRYHDEEWGVPVRVDRDLYEHLCLEGFQAGLSWTTVLHKRPAFRRHFLDFDFVRVARFTEKHIERIMSDPGIIRNRSKIVSAIGNAAVTRDLVADSPGALTELMWSFAPSGRRRLPRQREELPAVTPEAEAMSKELKKRGYTFVGPTTMYALMQSAGMVNDHIQGCFRADQVGAR